MTINENTIFKAVLKSPLIGSLISLFLFFIYYILALMFKSNNQEITSIAYWITSVWSFIKITPIVFICFSIVSYIVSIPFGIILYKLQNKYCFSEGYFWFYSFAIGLILGLVFGLINCYYENNIGKTILITLSFSFGALFNSSLFSVLTGKIPEKYKYSNKFTNK